MEEIYEVFDKSEQINVYSDGVKTGYEVGSETYNKILGGWNNLLDGAHQMPALGVSLNQLTLQQLEKNLWVEFEFAKEYECTGLPFEKLLVEVNKGYYGFNIIRYTKEYGYDGRCIYIDLVGKNMDDFYALLANL